MSTFMKALHNRPDTVTTNGRPAFSTTSNANVDLFFKIGAMRGKDIIPLFKEAFKENKDYSLRIAQHARDVREGAGERKVFRDILVFLESRDKESLMRLLPKVPELGRWDDLLIFTDPEVKAAAFSLIHDALLDGNGLCAKWMPREKSSKAKIAAELRAFLGMSSKEYRKMLVSLTSVVETAMCAKEWGNIDFSHIPSVAAARYKKAFYKNATEAYSDYVSKLVKGEAKINASAIFPHDVLKGIQGANGVEEEVFEAQWEALPNWMNGKKVLPVIDVSESMTCRVGGNPNLLCIDISVALGLYCANKTSSPLKGAYISFSMTPNMGIVKGSLKNQIKTVTSNKGYNTDLEKVFNVLLSFAKENSIAQEDMPDYILMLSDMQFDQGVGNRTAQKMIEAKYQQAGYSMPRIVYWNLHAHDNVPVKFDTTGVALVSGFSPAIMKSVLSDNFDAFSPENVMLETIMKERYNY